MKRMMGALMTMLVSAGGWTFTTGEAAEGGTGAASGPAAVSHVDAAGAHELIQNQKVVILDVRTPAEFKAGHLPGAKNVDFRAADFETKLGALDRSASYLVHCQSGRRSTSSLEIFKKLGFKSVVHLDGGYREWEKAGKPVEK